MRAAALLLLLPVVLAASPAPPDDVYLPVVDGTLVRESGHPMVYLVDRGRLRPVVGTAFDRLWGDFTRVCEVRRIPKTKVADPLGTGTRLARVKGHAHIWLVENGKVKRHVSDIPVFDRYGFRWGRVEWASLGEIGALPTGPPVR